MDNPCKDCLLYPVCFTKYNSGYDVPDDSYILMKISKKCSLLRKFLLDHYNYGISFNPFTNTEFTVSYMQGEFLEEVKKLRKRN